MRKGDGPEHNRTSHLSKHHDGVTCSQCGAPCAGGKPTIREPSDACWGVTVQTTLWGGLSGPFCSFWEVPALCEAPSQRYDGLPTLLHASGDQRALRLEVVGFLVVGVKAPISSMQGLLTRYCAFASSDLKFFLSNPTISMLNNTVIQPTWSKLCHTQCYIHLPPRLAPCG